MTNPTEGQDKRRFRILLGIIVVWWIGLGLMAFLTANPATISRLQLNQSQVVVTAKWDASENGYVVEQIWKGEVRTGSIISRKGLPDDAPKSQLILPLIKIRGEWEVTSPVVGRSKEGKPLHADPQVYPADAAHLERLKEILAE